jgi:C_GCAxxG_C_C family probable redox protein
MIIEQDKAIGTFRSGFNCAQSVLTAYSDELAFDNSLASCISCGFGAGMGRLQETCGAITGSFMVLGIHNGNKYSDNSERKEKTYAMIQQFSERFKSINGALDCKSLIKCDLKTEEGYRFAKENKLFDTLCEKYIVDSIEIIDGIIENKG